MTSKEIRDIINSCTKCQELEFKEQISNNDRIPIDIYHKAGKEFEDHLFSHFE